ncbi:acyl carrier protein [Aureobasidium pullulans]|uniref:Acyl carrier protein n=1 Tax=Aureobasidium pullulans TaxID=5580 RepID=A0A4S9P3I7_AURPU|nr:acyl carrier protein [Aureobasidium pullulans]THW04906.1 acyl carrier protein [Aureobasidium pullulans]THW10275.1 acyl carrier protein [Aureobasidium pullulans]THW29969.1 acyl carrier protein [Aureobasidium pullulans]THW61221.1 acyl carrier protein [Aureobasidium pullulans]
MFRFALARSARCLAQAAPRVQAPITRRVAPSSFLPSTTAAPSTFVSAVRCYSAHAGLSKDEVQGRILDLLKNFDKLSAQSHFTNDLGLDSLDTVEVVMAIEEEFSIEIPDKEADAIHSVNQAVEYILSQPDGKPARLEDYQTDF